MVGGGQAPHGVSVSSASFPDRGAAVCAAVSDVVYISDANSVANGISVEDAECDYVPDSVRVPIENCVALDNADATSNSEQLAVEVRLAVEHAVSLAHARLLRCARLVLPGSPRRGRGGFCGLPLGHVLQWWLCASPRVRVPGTLWDWRISGQLAIRYVDELESVDARG